MFSFNASSKHIRSLSTLGTAMKVSIASRTPSFITHDGVLPNKSLCEFFNFPKWLELFSLLNLQHHQCVQLFSRCLLQLSFVISDWNEDVKLYHGEKYLVTEAMINSFTWQMNLTVRNLHKQDFAPYMCSSENALGKSDTRIRLQGKKEAGKLIFSLASAH